MHNTTTTIRPNIGDRVRVDGDCGWWFTLGEDDGFSDSGFPGCEFRTEHDWRGDLFDGLAINIVVTGRTLRRIPVTDCYGYRVRIEYVGDCEPSTFVGGWIIFRGGAA